MSRKERLPFYHLSVPNGVEGGLLVVKECTPYTDHRGNPKTAWETFRFHGAPYSKWDETNGGEFEKIHDCLAAEHACVLHALDNSSPNKEDRILYVDPNRLGGKSYKNLMEMLDQLIGKKRKRHRLHSFVAK